MRAPSTLFFDIAAQRDLWPGGAWPLVDDSTRENIERLFAIAARLHVRQGGVMCLHDDVAAARDGIAAPHCLLGTHGADRAAECEPVLPPRVWHATAAELDADSLDRSHTDYLASGCAAAPDSRPGLTRVLAHVTAGILDVVVFGAAIELAMDRAVQALLRRRIRTHVVLDASSAVTAESAQQVISVWKRGTVDVTTTATIERLLLRNA